MYKLCNTEQSAKRQRYIEQVFFELMKKKNYNSITITELCLACDMPRKTFYRYFDSKDDTLYALIEHTMMDFEGFKTRSTEKNRTLKKEFEKFYLFWYENRELLDIFHKNDLFGKLFEIAINFPINDIINISKFLPDETHQIKNEFFKFAVCGLTMTVIEWYKDGFRKSISEMADISSKILSQPIFPNFEKITQVK